MSYIPTLKQQYWDTVLPELTKILGYTNRFEVPALEKIVVNSRIKAIDDKNRIKEVEECIGLLTGQKPVITKANESISNFKLRQGMPVGVKVTLRGANMWEFLFKLVMIALPNTRDFRGISPASFDGRGNYTLGIPDSTIFPEITNEGQKIIGMDITIVTTAKTDHEARELLKLMGMPFRGGKKQEEKNNES